MMECVHISDCPFVMKRSDEITEGHSLGLIKACKLYPAGATTNSEYGVTNISKLAGVLKVNASNNTLILSPHSIIFLGNV